MPASPVTHNTPALEGAGTSRDRPTGIAVLIVNFKAYELLRRCLLSVVPLLAPNDEIVVVDQETEAASLSRLGREFRGVRFIESRTNIGFAAGVNLAAQETRAAYLLLLNPDTVIEGSTMAVLREALAASPVCGIAGPRIVNDDGSVQASARRFPDATTPLGGRTSWLTRMFPQNWLTERNLVGRRASEAMRVDWVSGACLMTRRDVFEHLGGLDESFFLYWEDADYCRRALGAGFQTTYVPGALVQHTAGASSSGNPDLAIRAFHASALRMYRKHAGPAGRLATPVVQAVLFVRQHLRLRQAARMAASLRAHAPTSVDVRKGAAPIRADGPAADRALG